MPPPKDKGKKGAMRPSSSFGAASAQNTSKGVKLLGKTSNATDPKAPQTHRSKTPGGKGRRSGSGNRPVTAEQLKEVPPTETKDMLSNIDALVPSDEQVLQIRRLQMLADHLARSLATLRSGHSVLEQRLSHLERGGSAKLNRQAVLLPFQIRRMEAQREELKKEIAETTQTIQRLLLMSAQMEGVLNLKETITEEMRESLENEIASLKAEKEVNATNIREGFIDRINLLRRYWPWRQLIELGDNTVAQTFEEELSRGPRYRHIGIQNNIESDYLEQQIAWLEQLKARESTFRANLRQLDSFVEDVDAINDLMESSLKCKVCNLLFEEPVILWPCGHSFCYQCFQSLAIAPSLFRCHICGSIGSEGFVHNLLLAEAVGKWMFKDSGYVDLQQPLSSIRVHLSRFQKSNLEKKLKETKEILMAQKLKEATKNAMDPSLISISYRMY